MKDPRRLTAVIFDCDGTLVDTEPLARAAWALVLGPSQVRISEADVRRCTGRSFRATYDHFAEQAALPPAQVVEAELQQRLLVAIETHARAVPDAAAACRRLHERSVSMAVASSSARVRPVLRFPGLAGRTAPWREGEEVATWLLLFGVVPVSYHHLQVLEIDADAMRMVAHEWGGAVRRWEHAIWIEPLGEGRCRYTDRIEIDAGPFTAVVAGFAALFYRHRQRRWRRLAGRHLASPRPGVVAA